MQSKWRHSCKLISYIDPSSLSSFRFLLDASGDYTKQLNDPDISFDWDWIEQVVSLIMDG